MFDQLGVAICQADFDKKGSNLRWANQHAFSPLAEVCILFLFPLFALLFFLSLPWVADRAAAASDQCYIQRSMGKRVPGNRHIKYDLGKKKEKKFMLEDIEYMSCIQYTINRHIIIKIKRTGNETKKQN